VTDVRTSGSSGIRSAELQGPRHGPQNTRNEAAPHLEVPFDGADAKGPRSEPLQANAGVWVLPAVTAVTLEDCLCDADAVTQSRYIVRPLDAGRFV